jgi:hypothetical protein
LGRAQCPRRSIFFSTEPYARLSSSNIFSSSVISSATSSSQLILFKNISNFPFCWTRDTAFSMEKASAGATNPYPYKEIRVVVAGDRGTGKSSLILTATGRNCPTNVPPVLPPTRLPDTLFPVCVPITIIDTSSRYALFGVGKV